MTQNSALSYWAIQYLYSRISLFPCLIYLIQKQWWWMFAVCWILRVELSRTHTCPTHPPSSQLLHLLPEISDSSVPSTPLFPVNISPLLCNLELSASAVLGAPSASAVLWHQGWMALLHCCEAVASPFLTVIFCLGFSGASWTYTLIPTSRRIKCSLASQMCLYSTLRYGQSG